MLSFPPPTKMFPFGGFPLGTPGETRFPERHGLLRPWQEAPFGDPGFNGCMRLPRAYRRLPRPSSAPEPSHPPGGVRAVRPAQGRGPGPGLAGPWASPTCRGPLRSPGHHGSEAVRGWPFLGPPAATGGDPAAGSPTATLLRLLPPRGGEVRPHLPGQPPGGRASPLPRSGGATGGVCKEQGRIHRAMLTRGY